MTSFANLFGIMHKRYLCSSMSNKLTNICVIGSGIMGTGIAQVAIETGHHVSLTDVNTDSLLTAVDAIQNGISRTAKKKFPTEPDSAKNFVRDAMNRLYTHSDSLKAVRNADLVIEAIVENLYNKEELFTQIDHSAKESTIFATNTSSLPVSRIAQVTTRLDRFVGLHFFNPVPLMKLIELVKIPETSDDTYQKVHDFGKALGKHIVCCKDTPGFIVNRLLLPYLVEASLMLERGDATAEDIDAAMKYGAGYPMGPFKLMDIIGLDTVKLILDGWHKHYPDLKRFKVPKIIENLVATKAFGTKSGEGFYNYNKK